MFEQILILIFIFYINFNHIYAIDLSNSIIIESFSITNVYNNNITSRNIKIQAKDILNNNINTGGQLFIAELLPTSLSSCNIGILTPKCKISCSPLNSPHISSPSCLSSNNIPTIHNADTHYVLGNTTDHNNGLYTINIAAEKAISYNMSIMHFQSGGLNAKYYDNKWLLDTPVLQRVDNEINFDWSINAITEFGVDYVSARWEGKIVPLYSELYTIFADADDGVRVWIDKQLIIDKWDTCCNETWSTVTLVANHLHDIVIEYKEEQGGAYITISWASISQAKQIIPSNRLYYGTQIVGSPMTVIMQPAIAHSSFTTANGLSLTNGNAMEINTFEVTLYDIFGNQLLDSDNGLSITMNGNSIATINQQHIGNGVYRCNYTVNLIGSYQLYIIVNGANITTSPYTLNIVAGTANISTTNVWGNGLISMTAGVSNNVFIQPRDNGNNNRTGQLDTVHVVLNTPSTILGVTTLQTSTGIYISTLVPDKSGSYSLGISLNGQHLQNSPYTITVSSGPLDVSKTTIEGSTYTSVIAGIPTSFIVQARDQFGNARTTSIETLIVSMTSINTGHIINMNVDNLGDGKYNISYTPDKVDTYTLVAKINSIHIEDSPSQIIVNVGNIYIPACTATGTGISTAISGELSQFTIQSRDNKNNALTNDPSVTWSIVLTCSGTINGLATYSNNGKYDVTYWPTETGTCSLDVTIASTHINGSPFSITITPGAPSVSTTIPNGAGLLNAIAGIPTTFLVIARDNQSNLITSTSAIIESYLLNNDNNNQHVQGNITTNQNGTYIVKYTPKLSGNFTHQVLMTVQGGLYVTYYADEHLSTAILQRSENEINYDWGYNKPISSMPSHDYFSIAWRGKIKSLTTGSHTFYIIIAAGSGTRLYIDENLLIDAWTINSGSVEVFGTIALTASTYHDIELQYRHSIGAAKISLMWQSTSMTKRIIDSTNLYVFANLSGSPFTTEVSPGTINASQTIAYVTNNDNNMITSWPVDETLYFIIEPKDSLQNTQINGGNSGNFIVTLEEIDTNIISNGIIVDIGNGLYNVSVSNSQIGTGHLTIKYNGVHIKSSPFTILLEPGKVSPNQCNITGTNISSAIASIENTLTIHAQNIYGHLVPSFTGIFTVTLNGANSGVIPTIINQNDGTLIVTFIPIVSGIFQITIQYDGINIQNSPLTVNISPGPISATQSNILQYNNGTANVISNIVVSTADAQGNIATSGGTNFVVRIDNHRGDWTSGDVTDLNNGQYNLTYLLTQSGEYTLHIKHVGDHGLTGEYFSNMWLYGTPTMIRIDPFIEFDFGNQAIIDNIFDYASIRWSGYLKVPTSGSHTIQLDVNDGVRLFIDGVLLINQWDTTGDGSYSIVHNFSSEKTLYEIQIDYKETTGTASCKLYWDIGSGIVIIPTTALYSSSTPINGTPRTLYIN